MLCKADQPPAREAIREVANITLRKFPHQQVYGVIESVCLSISPSMKYISTRNIIAIVNSIQIIHNLFIMIHRALASLINYYNQGSGDRWSIIWLWDKRKFKFFKKTFPDEIDALIKDRKDSKNETGTAILSALLVEMDGKRNNCYVLANTNVPKIIGESIIRDLFYKITHFLIFIQTHIVHAGLLRLRKRMSLPSWLCPMES